MDQHAPTVSMTHPSQRSHSLDSVVQCTVVGSDMHARRCGKPPVALCWSGAVKPDQQSADVSAPVKGIHQHQGTSQYSMVPAVTPF